MTQILMKLKRKYLTRIIILLLKTLNFAARLNQAKLRTRDDIANFIKKVYFDKKLMNINKKVNLNKTRHVEVKKKVDQLSKTNINKRINDEKYFSLDGTQSYLVFQPLYSYFTSQNGKIYSWQSPGNASRKYYISIYSRP